MRRIKRSVSKLYRGRPKGRGIWLTWRDKDYLKEVGEQMFALYMMQPVFNDSQGEGLKRSIGGEI